MGYWKFSIEESKKKCSEFKDVHDDVEEYLKLYEVSDAYQDKDKQLKNCLINFFNAPHIIEAVKANNWEEVFRCWRADWQNLHHDRLSQYYGNKPGYPLCRLVHFLYMVGVEFDKYLTHKTIEGLNEYNDLEHSGLVWTEDEHL